MKEFPKILLLQIDEVDKTLFKRALIEAGVNARLNVMEEFISSDIKDLNRYSSIFIDYRIENKTGLNVCRNIREMGYEGPIVIITPYTDIPFINEMNQAGATDFIPYTLLNREGIFHTIRIINKIKEIENEKNSIKEKLNESLKSYRDLVENTQLHIFTHDKKGKITFINPIAAGQLEYEQEELVGVNINSIIEPSLKNFFKEYIENLRSKKITVGIMQVVSKSGKDHYWFFKAFLSPTSLIAAGSEKDPETITVLANDITERILAEKELLKAKQITQESNKIKERFLANMSHEIRTPMNAILGFTKILLSSDLTTEQKDYIREIDNSGTSLMKIVNDILDFSKIETEKINYDFKDFNISEILNNVIDIYRSNANEKKIKILHSIDKNIPEILYGDIVRLNQIFLNLIGNAVKFTEKGWVEISAKPVIDYENEILIEFAVQDTGIGIPEERLPHIFDSFTQASYDTTRKYGGTGLGLTIVKRLIEIQGGSISVESTENEGTTFKFSLKFRKVLPKQRIKPKTEINISSEPEPEKIKILLFESNPVNQMIDEKLLMDFGFNILTASNEDDAFSKLNENDFDVILIDTVEAGLISENLKKELTKNNFDIPVMVISRSEDLDNLNYQNIDGTILKPFNKIELRNKLNKILLKNEKEKKEVRIETSLKKLKNGIDKLNPGIENSLIKQLPNYLDGMNEAVNKKNWERLSAIAGKFKSVVSLTGNKELEYILESIEKNSSEKINLHLIPGLINHFKITSEDLLKNH